MVNIKPYMHSLHDLRESLKENGVEILESQGWYLICDNHDRWTILDGVCYLNGTGLDKKQVQDYLKNPPKAKKKSALKMMRAKDYFENEVYDECESVEVSY